LKRLPEVIIALLLVFFFYMRLPSNPWNRIVHSDGKGYFAYLPALFIYNDLSYGFADAMEKKYYPEDGSLSKHFRFKFKGETVNKTFSGIALLWLPFFLIAHFLSYLFGFPTDGYSLLYQLSIGIAALFYFYLGIRYLIRLLRSFNIAEHIISFTTVAIVFGTNLLYYVLCDPSLTHAYNFSLITALFYHCRSYSLRKKSRDLVLATALFGLILWIRPQNGFVAFAIPFVLGQWNHFLDFIKSLFTPISRSIGLVFLFLSIIAMPMLLWYAQTGYFLVYSYGNERFVFSNPQFFNVLFSYQKGLFVYSPIVFISLFGLLHCWKTNRFQLFTFLLFAVVTTYVISSWEEWWYGCSYGHRVFIDYYAIVAILLAFLLIRVEKRPALSLLIKAVIGLLIVFNFIQIYQHYNAIVPTCITNKALYWKHFLQLTPNAEVVRNDENYETQLIDAFDIESERNNWQNTIVTQSTEYAFSGSHSSKINSSSPYSVTFGDTMPLQAGEIMVRAKLYVPSSGIHPKLVIDFQQTDGNSVVYRSFALDRYLRSKQWFEVTFITAVPKELPEKSRLCIYFWNPESEQPLFVDDITIYHVLPKHHENE
jgi:hypothetical protein